MAIFNFVVDEKKAMDADWVKEKIKNEKKNCAEVSPPNFWGNNKYILPCIDRYTKFPSAKIVNNTSTRKVTSFLNDYCHLHGFPRKFGVDHGSCFLSHDFKNFCEKLNMEIFYCTAGNHRSNGLVERLVYTIKSKLLAMSFEFPRQFLGLTLSLPDHERIPARDRQL